MSEPVRFRRGAFGHVHEVFVHDVEMTRVGPTFSGYLEKVLSEVWERTPTQWWLDAYEIEMASRVEGTGGPLGHGVDFFSHELGPLVPPEVRQEIEEDAAEAAREAILAGLTDHAQRILNGLPALGSTRKVKPCTST